MSTDFGATQRSIANRALTKVLLMGLGGSILFHTVAIAGISYWAHHHPDEQMEIVEIDRVEVAPPSLSPSTKPISKVVKPPITASIPTPIPIKISTPQATFTPVTVVKVTKSVAIKSSNSPLANIGSPVVKRFTPPAKIVSINSPNSNPNPSFPDRLSSDPLPKNIPFKSVIEARNPTSKTLPQQTKLLTRKIENNPSQSSPSKYPQPTTAKKLTALAPTSKPAKLATNSIPDTTGNPPAAEKLIPSLPSNISKLAQTTDRSIPSDNQPKSPPELGSNLGALAEPLPQQNPLWKRTHPNIPPRRDRLTGVPENNTQVANNNRQTPAPANNNSPVNLGVNPPKRSGIDANIINKSGGDRPNRDRDIMGEVPRNNTQIARNHGGDNGVKLGNQTNLGGSNQQHSSIDSGLNGNDRSNSSSSNKPSAGTPGNMAAGSRNRVSIQCLRNCEIRYPDELENSDIGKDKILVKVTIDPNGAVTNAEIDRSSGNQNLDRVTLEGVKQMQLTATGQTRIYRIKISTLLR